MAHFLFPASPSVDKGKRKDDYPALLADIVRGATDSIDALNHFRDLVAGYANGPDTPGFMAFDAHVGETGCHLRAGMVREVFSTYRCLSQNNPGAWQTVENWLDDTIASLQGASAQARAACVKLTKDKVKPNQLGFNQKQETPRKILVVLGWSEPEQSFSFAAQDENIVQEFEPLTSTSSTSTLENDKPTANSYLDRTLWDVFKSAILARFIVHAYVLSKYKAFNFYNGSPNGSLQPQAADDFTRKLMRDSWDTESASVRRPGLRRLDNEFRDLQVWLSELSCAWLQSLAKRSRLPCDMSSLISSTTQRSRLGLAAAACYPGYLLEREFLERQSTPVILVDRHFCTHGYHINVFEASITTRPPKTPHGRGLLAWLQALFQCVLPTNTTPDDDRHPQSPICPPQRWRIKRTSIDVLLAAGDPTTPHMVVTGNSLRGSHAQYTNLVRASLAEPGSSRPTNSLPHSGRTVSKGKETPCRCDENESHITDFLHADHDRLALAFFAVHCAYSFPLASGEDEVAFVERAMDAWAGEKEQVQRGVVVSPAGLWRASRNEADRLGTGAGSMHVFRWQHAFVESRGRLGWLLGRSLAAADLMPLKAVLPGDA